MYNEPGGRLGRRPETIPTTSGFARKIWITKHKPIVATSARMTASTRRMPHRCK